LALQHTEEYADLCRVIRNEGDLAALELQVNVVWGELVGLA
jgi:hypothetical protein